jgi:hypothetical protein
MNSCYAVNRKVSLEKAAEELRQAVEALHHCRATFAQTVPVREVCQGQVIWEGVVHVFDITDHPEATRAYAWASPIDDSTYRRFFAVLQLGAIVSPVDAVRAAIIAEPK